MTPPDGPLPVTLEELEGQRVRVLQASAPGLLTGTLVAVWRNPTPTLLIATEDGPEMYVPWASVLRVWRV